MASMNHNKFIDHNEFIDILGLTRIYCGNLVLPEHYLDKEDAKRCKAIHKMFDILYKNYHMRTEENVLSFVNAFDALKLKCQPKLVDLKLYQDAFDKLLFEAW